MRAIEQTMTPAEQPMPATARLRAQLFLAQDVDALVSLFAAALAEHGIAGHFHLSMRGAVAVPMAGDAPELVLEPAGSTIVVGDGVRIVMAAPASPLSPAAAARVRGYAELVGAQIAALREWADDVETACGLSLRERYVLGRRLAGLAPVDIAIEAGLSVQTVSRTIDDATAAMGVTTPAEAIALAARRGWLAVTSMTNCSTNRINSMYRMTQNG